MGKRSKWKGPVVTKIGNKYRLVLKRNEELTTCLLNKTVWCHDGKKYGKTEITHDMLGKKIGEFVFTRSEFSFKKKK